MLDYRPGWHELSAGEHARGPAGVVRLPIDWADPLAGTAVGRGRGRRRAKAARQLDMGPAVAGQYGRMDPRQAADLYETSSEAVEILLRDVPLHGPVLEPSAGRGAIVSELRRAGLEVRSRARDRDRCRLPVTTSMSGCRSVVMNPPFRDAEAYVRHALSLLPRGGTLAVLLRMTWIAAKARRARVDWCAISVTTTRRRHRRASSLAVGELRRHIPSATPEASSPTV